MKETTGELNAAVVVIMAIGVLMAFFYYTIWPMMRENFNKNSQCSKAICDPCKDPSTGKIVHTCDYVECHSKDDPNTIFKCVYKG